MRKPTLEFFQPSRDELLHHVSDLVDDSMLKEISEADAGDEAEEHLSCLRRLRDLGEVPLPQWNPLEVLELIRWSEPEDPAWKPGSPGRRGHIMRAFACAALLRMGCEPGNRDRLIGENQALIQLVGSVSFLGEPFPLLTRRFLAWRLSNLPENDEERPFFILALILLALSVQPHPPEPEVEDLIDWLMEDEQRIRESNWVNLPEYSDTWLLGLTFYDLRHDAWVNMVPRIIEFAKIVDSARLRQGLSEVAHRLAHNQPLQWRR
jgi:hypothetical protein